jgi:protein-tyrosine phosphatase
LGKKINHIPQIPFPRSYWVIPGKLLAGHVPTDNDPVVSEEKIKNLLNCGIKTIINLQEENELNNQGLPFSKYYLTLPKEVSFHRKSIPDFGIPTKETMVEILRIIDESIANNKAVYVHCWGGIGRTGTVIGCFMKKNKMASSENFIDALAYLRKNDPENHRTSPETSQQIEFVKSF